MLADLEPGVEAGGLRLLRPVEEVGGVELLEHAGVADLRHAASVAAISAMMRRMALALHRPTDVDAFMALAGQYLAAREAEHNLFFGIAWQIRSAPELFAIDPPTYAVVTDAGGRVVAATMRTPPNNQVLSQIDDHQAVDLLADALAGEQLPGVLGPKEAAERFATRWADRARTTARLDVAERIFRLERVVPPARPAGGRWRLAGISDRDLIAGWITAFHEEATPGQPPVGDPE